jgi:DNA-binding SARP family transcriptional activator
VPAGAFHLRVLGGFALEGPAGAPATALPQRRAEAVLAVLAVSGAMGCSRERLVSLLWPERDEAHARHGLRSTLHAIRRALGSDAVAVAGEFLRLDPDVVTSDVGAFARAVAAKASADAVRAYRGDLLEGVHLDDAPGFERWLDAERARLAREYANALQSQALVAEAAGDWVAASDWWARAVEHDPLNSRLVSCQLRALVAAGDRANALRAAELHGRRLEKELGLAPDGAFVAAVAAIRNGESLARGEGPVAAAARGGASVQASGEWLTASSDGIAASSPPAPVRPRRRRSRAAVLAAAVVVAVALLALVVASVM